MLLNHAEKNYANQTEKSTLPPTICQTPAGPVSPKSTERGEPEPLGPRSTICPHSKPQGIVEREPLPGELQPPKPRNKTSATADRLHRKPPSSLCSILSCPRNHSNFKNKRPSRLIGIACKYAVHAVKKQRILLCKIGLRRFESVKDGQFSINFWYHVCLQRFNSKTNKLT